MTTRVSDNLPDGINLPLLTDEQWSQMCHNNPILMGGDGEYAVQEDQWSRDANGKWMRTILKVRLYYKAGYFETDCNIVQKEP